MTRHAAAPRFTDEQAIVAWDEVAATFFEPATDGYTDACWLAVGRALLTLRQELADAHKEIAGLRAFKAGVDEALNSGDGSYRP